MRALGLAVTTLALIPGAAYADGAVAPYPIATLSSVQPVVAEAAMLPVAARTLTASATFRVKPISAPVNRTFRLNDPESMLQPGYAGMFDLFPVAGGKFHISGGSRLFSRTGRFRTVEPESLQYLQPFRAGSLRASRKFRPALLVGYGRTLDRGFSLGFDAGVIKGKVGATPDRLGRLNRARLSAFENGGHANGWGQVARVTALYRF